MVNERKKLFLEREFIPTVQQINSSVEPRWGKMTVQQMVEHVSMIFKVSTNKIAFPATTAAEHLPKYREFLLSEKEFRENTKAPFLPSEPLATQCSTMQEALTDLEAEVNHFFSYFKDDPERKTLHPVFGQLNFAEWVQFHHKHVKHHMKQFGKEIPVA